MSLSTLRNALLFNPSSVFSNVGVLLLWEKGVQNLYPLKPIDMQQGQNITPDYIRINPTGKVPVLIHEAQSIPDSLAIAQFLDAHYNTRYDLGSLDDKVVATLEQWRQVRVLALWMGKKHPDQDTSALAQQLQQSRQHVLDYQKNTTEDYTIRLTMHDDRARVLLDHPTFLHHEQQWHRLLARTDDALAQQPYVAGHRFSLADVYATSFLFWMTQKVDPSILAHHARLKQYYDRQLERDSVRNAFGLC